MLTVCKNVFSQILQSKLRILQLYSTFLRLKH